MSPVTDAKLTAGFTALDSAEWRASRGIPDGPISQALLAEACREVDGRPLDRKTIRLIELRAQDKLLRAIHADPDLLDLLRSYHHHHGPRAVHHLFTQAFSALRSSTSSSSSQ